MQEKDEVYQRKMEEMEARFMREIQALKEGLTERKTLEENKDKLHEAIEVAPNATSIS